jgi:rhodanese-related sulfurtransferase
MQVFRSLLLEASILVACACLLGLSFNYQLLLDVLEGRLAATEPVAQEAIEPGGFPQPVVLAGVEDLLAQGALLVDARSGDVYALGRLAGARSLPLAEWEHVSAAFRAEVPPERTLIAYCSGYGCPDSFDLAVVLIAAGYRAVRVYEGGFPEWRDAGLPVESGAP